MLTSSITLWRCALLSAATLLFPLGPAAGQDATETPSATADDSATQDLLPAPDRKPISRVVRAGDSAIESQSPPETTTDATFAAVPTTPILSSDLPSGAADEPFGSEGSEESVIPDRPIGSDAPTDSAGASEPLVPATSDQPAADTAAATESTAAAEPPPDSTAAPEPAAGTEEAASEEKEAEDDAEEVEQTAAVAPIEGMIRIVYASEASKVTDPAKELLAPLVAKLNEDYSLRVKVLAYAEGDEDQSTHARGVSLARALAIREYLAGQGIAMDRLDLRALGNTAQEEPADRVDLIAVPE